MARKKEFDRDHALRQAIGAFRRKGYAGTSTEDLLAAMGIGRQSMYDTFGDKRRLFLDALQRYNDDSVGAFIGDLALAPAPLAGLEAALLAFAAQAVQGDAGCMGVQAVCEFGVTDAEVAQLTGASGQRQAAALERHLQAAKAAGELPAEMDEKVAARYLGATVAGMRVSARAGMPLPALQEIVRFAMQALRR